MSAILGRKLGMTSIFTEEGQFVPCTVIEAGPCPVVQIKTKDTDGYESVQIGFEPLPERKVIKPIGGHFAKNNVAPQRFLKEFKQLVDKVHAGDVLTVESFAVGDTVKISATSKGKGFQGVVRRHHFGGVGMSTVRAPLARSAPPPTRQGCSRGLEWRVGWVASASPSAISR
jgi:large subunit ribosomal protein L3